MLLALEGFCMISGVRVVARFCIMHTHTHSMFAHALNCHTSVHITSVSALTLGSGCAVGPGVNDKVYSQRWQEHSSSLIEKEMNTLNLTAGGVWMYIWWGKGGWWTLQYNLQSSTLFARRQICFWYSTAAATIRELSYMSGRHDAYDVGVVSFPCSVRRVICEYRKCVRGIL